MKSQVAYVVNEDPVYLEMTETSIRLLRQHNGTIPVTVFLVEDTLQQRSAGFIDFCDRWGVRIRTCPDVSDGYFQDNKVHLGQCESDRVLVLDADTFVFADPEELFATYAGFDVVGCTNDWVWHRGYRADLIPGNPVPLNSGVLLCSSRFLRSWTKQMPGLHETLRTGGRFPALTRWLYDVSASAYNREEFGVTICSRVRDFRTTHFADADCKLLKYKRLDADLARFRSCTKIFHSYSQHWRRCAARI